MMFALISWCPSPLSRHLSIVSPVATLTEAQTLEQRLQEFYHWRGNLMLFLYKFATLLAPTYYDRKKKKHMDFILYLGVNGKMILDPSATHSFYGPLSTTTSYHVAQTFATGKGMVLAIQSQYPRLRECNAFDASSMSDYPEEQEHLIGHIYLRIRKIYIKPPTEFIHMDSKLKLAFFAVHLFREHIFSMNAALEAYLVPFLQIHLRKVARVDTAAYGAFERSPMYRYLSDVVEWNAAQSDGKCPKPPGVVEQNGKDRKCKNQIFYILSKKF